MSEDRVIVNVESLPKRRFVSSISNWISLAALGVSIAALVFTIIHNAGSGPAEPLPITAHAIMRGYAIGEFPSDHLIIPIEWVNRFGQPALVRQPILTLNQILTKEQQDNGVKSKRKIFYIAGHYPEISVTALEKPFIQSQSYLIEGHSAKLLNLVFHIKNWYNEDDVDTFYFTFEPQEVYSVKVRFLDADNKCHQADLGYFGTYDCDCLILRHGIVKNPKKTYPYKDCQKNERWWDFHPIDLGHEKGQPPPEKFQHTNFDTRPPWVCGE